MCVFVFEAPRFDNVRIDASDDCGEYRSAHEQWSHLGNSAVP